MRQHVLLVYLVLVALAAACGAQQTGPDKTTAPSSPAAQSVIEVEAFTTPFRELELASETPGILLEVHVEEGDAVKKGQPLVELRSDILRAQLAVDQGRVESAKVLVSAAESTYKTRSNEYQRVRDLFETNVASKDEHEKAKLERELAELSLRSARTDQKVYELTVARDVAALKQTVILAPIDGDVFRILKHPGEAAEEYRPVLVIVAIDPLFVIAYVPIRVGNSIRADDKAVFALDHDRDRPLTCQVAVVDRVGDAASGMCRIKLTLPNPERRIKAGSKGKAVFRLSE